MEKKPKMVILLFALWLIIGFLFLGLFVSQLMSYWSYLEISAESSFLMSGITSSVTYSYILFDILFLGIAIFAYILVDAAYYGKKWCWLAGIIYTSALAYTAFTGLYVIILIISAGLYAILVSYQVIVYICMLFLVPATLYVLLKPEIRSYFGKT